MERGVEVEEDKEGLGGGVGLVSSAESWAERRWYSAWSLLAYSRRSSFFFFPKTFSSHISKGEVGSERGAVEVDPAEGSGSVIWAKGERGDRGERKEEMGDWADRGDEVSDLAMF